jgi:hypothetical protein
VRASIFALALLTGCSFQTAHEGRVALMGRAYTEMEKCLGVPAATDIQPDGSTVYQWNIDNNSQVAIPLSEMAELPLTLPMNLAGTSVSLGGNGSCRMIVHAQKLGAIDSVEFEGITDGLIGVNGNCAPLVQGCLRMLTRQHNQQHKEVVTNGTAIKTGSREDRP